MCRYFPDIETQTSDTRTGVSRTDVTLCNYAQAFIPAHTYCCMCHCPPVFLREIPAPCRSAARTYVCMYHYPRVFLIEIHAEKATIFCGVFTANQRAARHSGRGRHVHHLFRARRQIRRRHGLGQSRRRSRRRRASSSTPMKLVWARAGAEAGAGAHRRRLP
jgi:hypothetical protein